MAVCYCHHKTEGQFSEGQASSIFGRTSVNAQFIFNSERTWEKPVTNDVVSKYSVCDYCISKRALHLLCAANVV
jgi:hypothetical protein